MVDKKQISKLYSAAKLSEIEQSVLEYLLNNIDTLDDIGIKPRRHGMLYQHDDSHQAFEKKARLPWLPRK